MQKICRQKNNDNIQINNELYLINNINVFFSPAPTVVEFIIRNYSSQIFNGLWVKVSTEVYSVKEII